jgi:UDP-N-acetylglucosamine:LPS N-acetylglucosamine transferase
LTSSRGHNASIQLVTLSTVGHVQPYLALAAELKARGHLISWLAYPDSETAERMIAPLDRGPLPR